MIYHMINYDLELINAILNSAKRFMHVFND